MFVRLDLCSSAARSCKSLYEVVLKKSCKIRDSSIGSYSSYVQLLVSLGGTHTSFLSLWIVTQGLAFVGNMQVE